MRVDNPSTKRSISIAALGLKDFDPLGFAHLIHVFLRDVWL